jgi:hypothetical protein
MAPLPTTSRVLRSQPDRYIFFQAEIPAKNSPAISCVQAVGRFSFQACRYQWFFNHLIFGQQFGSLRVLFSNEFAHRV